MRLLKATLLLFLMFGPIICYGQDFDVKNILGKWEGTRRETISGRKTLNNGKPITNPVIYEFGKDHYVLAMVAPPGEQVPYAIKGDILTIGVLHYIIEKLTEKELVLLDYKEGNRKYPLAFRHFFKKAKR